ncbi:MAG TPA: hypothetical protein PLR96_11540, partial [Flavobacteriales bacterium]|nr:hypothetical protein [Flavobacteriales bacterium]
MALFGSLQFHSMRTRATRSGLLVILLFLLLTGVVPAQAPSWNWEISPSNGNDSWIRDMAVDPNDGSVYVVGKYRQAGILGLPNPAGNADAFLAKLNSTGIVQWSVRIGTSSDDEAYGVVVAENGAVALTGGFEGNLQAGTTSGVSLAVNSISGSEDVFIACYSPSGTLQWLSRAGGSNADHGTSIVSGDFGFAVQGLFTNGIAFQSAGVPIILAPAAVSNQTMAFVATFDPMTGSCTKAVMATATGAMNPERMATDGENIFVTGTHRGNTITWRSSEDAAIGGNNAGAATMANAYVTTFNTALDHKWSSHVSNPGDVNISCNGIAFGCGRIYITGNSHAGSTYAGLGAGTASTHDHAFLAALNLEDGQGAWIHTAQGNDAHSQLGYDLTVSNDGDILMAGRFVDAVTFDTGETISGPSGTHGFVARYTPTGDLEWVQPVLSDDALDLMAVAVQGPDQVYIGGSLEGSCS